eukprot:1196405-Rhodomonas_salina.2
MNAETLGGVNRFSKRKFVGAFIVFSIVVIQGFHGWTISQSRKSRPFARAPNLLHLQVDAIYQ